MTAVVVIAEAVGGTVVAVEDEAGALIALKGRGREDPQLRMAWEARVSRERGAVAGAGSAAAVVVEMMVADGGTMTDMM